MSGTMGRLTVSSGEHKVQTFTLREGSAVASDAYGNVYSFALETVAPPPAEYQRALELLALTLDAHLGNYKVEERDFEEMRRLVEGKGLLFEESSSHEPEHEEWDDAP